MGKLFRYLIYLFGLIVILIVAAVILVPRFFDPNDFKPQITSLVKEKTGREMVIDGEIKLSVFPWVGVSLGKVVLNELPEYGAQELFAVNSADVKVKLLPLLSKKVELDRISLDGLKLNLVRLTDGAANWELLKVNDQPVQQNKSITTQKRAEKKESKASDHAGMGLAALSIAGLSLHNATITYDDRATQQKVVIDQLNLNVDEVAFDNPIPFDAEFIAKVSQPQLQDGMKVTGRLKVNEALDQFSVDQLELETTVKGAVVQDGIVELNLNSSTISFDKRTQSVKLPAGLKLTVNGKGGQLPATFNAKLQLPKASINNQFSQFDLGAIDFTAELEGDALKQGKVEISLGSPAVQFDKNSLAAQLPGGLKLVVKGGGGELPEHFNANLQLPGISISSQETFDLGQISLNVHAEGEQFPNGKIDARLITTISGDLAAQELTLSDIRLSALELVVKGQLAGRKIIDAPEFKGKLSIDELNAKKLANDIGITLPEMQDASALTRLALTTDVHIKQKAANFSELNIKLDDSLLHGQLAVNDFDTQAIAFNLILDKINVDRYLPPKSRQSSKTESQPATSKMPASSSAKSENTVSTEPEAEVIPIEAIRKLNVDGKLIIEELRVNGLKAKDIQFSVNGKNGFIDARPSIGSFYQGSINAGIVIKARQELPTLKLNNRVKHIAIEPLLKELTDKTYLSGTANMTTHLKAQGATERAIISTLNGEITANFLDGAIYGINIPKMIRDGISTLQGKAINQQTVNKTDFSELNMLSTINNGIVTTEKLELKSPLIRILGKGTLDLNTKQLQYRTSVKLVDTLKGQGGASPTSLTGIPIPLVITGTLDNIRYELDTQAALQEALKTKVGKQAGEKTRAIIDKNKAKVMDKINKKLGDKLGTDLEKGAEELLKGLF